MYIHLNLFLCLKAKVKYDVSNIVFKKSIIVYFLDILFVIIMIIFLHLLHINSHELYFTHQVCIGSPISNRVKCTATYRDGQLRNGVSLVSCCWRKHTISIYMKANDSWNRMISSLQPDVPIYRDAITYCAYWNLT